MSTTTLKVPASVNDTSNVVDFARSAAAVSGSSEVLEWHLLIGVMKAAKKLVNTLAGDPKAASSIIVVAELYVGEASGKHKLAVPEISEIAKRVLEQAYEIATQNSATGDIHNEHILLAFLQVGNSFIQGALGQYGLTQKNVLEAIVSLEKGRRLPKSAAAASNDQAVKKTASWFRRLVPW